jgi:LmbE family N-acetylglucosaminyl deacetylase
MTQRFSYAAVMSSFLLVSPQKVIGDRDLLVVAPHPDDESLGCGGLLAWAAASGNKPRVLFLTDGEGSHPGSHLYPPDRLGNVRRSEGKKACAALGLSEVATTFLAAPDSGLLALSDEERAALVSNIRSWVEKSNDAVICIPAASDPHSDHVAAHVMVKEAVRCLQNIELLAYAVWTWITDEMVGSEMPEGRRIDIEEFRERKRKAIFEHQSQHGTLINDAANPFVLPEGLLRFSDLPYEVLLNVKV